MEEKKSEDDNSGRTTDDFLYNDISAARLKEFEVIKINNRGKRQPRVLGIDGFNIYNDKTASDKSRGSILKSILGKSFFKVKRKTRPLDSLIQISRLNNKTISMVFKEKKGTKKREFECGTEDNCSEIIAKINYLLNKKNNPAPSPTRPNAS